MLSSLSKLYSQGVPINWSNYHRYSGGSKTQLGHLLPGYAFEESSYWMPMKEDGSSPFHPLLGAFLPNATETTIFKNLLHVNRLPFLKDHALGDKIIFPCAGYLDMCMTAGYAATCCVEGSYVKPGTGSPLSLNNFSILTPIALNEMSPTEFQVSTILNENLKKPVFFTWF